MTVAETGNNCQTIRKFTQVYHDIMDSEAARLLSPVAFVLLIDFLRAWLRETHNGKREVGSIHFTYTKCRHIMARNTYQRAKRELRPRSEENPTGKGFIRLVNARVGLYAWSRDWRTYTPTDNERSRLSRHEEARREQAMRTAAYRSGQRLGTRAGVSSGDNRGTTGRHDGSASGENSGTTEQAIAAQNSGSAQCAGTGPPAAAKNRGHFNTPNTDNTTTPSPRLHRQAAAAAADAGPGGGGQECLEEQIESGNPEGPDGSARRFATVDGRDIQIWPIPAFECHDALLAWMEIAPLKELTEDEYWELMERVDRDGWPDDREEDRESSFRRTWRAATRDVFGLCGDGELDDDSGKAILAAVAAQALSSPNRRGEARVLDVLERFGSRQLRRAVIGLIREDAEPDKAMQWLEHRAKVAHATLEKAGKAKGDCEAPAAEPVFKQTEELWIRYGLKDGKVSYGEGGAWEGTTRKKRWPKKPVSPEAAEKALWALAKTCLPKDEEG